MPLRERKTERKATIERKDALIAATLKCLSEEGHEGLSIRKISAEAGVSLGLINHHYADKEDLVAQAYEHLTLSHLEIIKAAVDAAEGTSRAQLRAYIRATVAVTSDPGVFRAWVVFWGMNRPGNTLQEIFSRTYREYRDVLENILRRLADDHGIPLLDVRLSAIGLLALIDGLWIVLSLNPDAISEDEAVRLADAWIDSVVLRAVSTSS
jgi:AcrR family transcriptional regulator